MSCPSIPLNTGRLMPQVCSSHAFYCTSRNADAACRLVSAPGRPSPVSSPKQSRQPLKPAIVTSTGLLSTSCSYSAHLTRFAVLATTAMKLRYDHSAPTHESLTGPQVGEGIKNGLESAGLKREDIFVTSKLWNTFHRKA